MKSFFEPKSIAVAGVSADPDKLGSIIFANLQENRRKGLLKATVYPLNPTRDTIGGVKCYPDVGSLPERAELLIVAVPEPETLGLVREAADAGVRAAIIVTSGYGEAGKGDVEQEVGRAAARRGMRVLGPNTIGVVDTWSGVDSLFLRPTKRLPDGGEIASAVKPLRGEVAVVSQSGHLAQVVSEALAAVGVGVRALVGTGNQLDVSVEDVVQYLADDPHTKVISVYLEGVRDGRRFMQAASYASRRKPLVVFKVGKTDVGGRAAFTHTASMVGDYEAYRAAFRQCGIVEATSFQDLVDFSVALLMLPRSPGKRLAILTNAGGVGAIAADEAQRSGLVVQPFDAKIEDDLRSQFQSSKFASNASFRNPIDLTATAPTDDFVRCADRMMALPEVDLGLILPTHQTPAIGHDIAKKLGETVLKSKKPACMCVIGNSDFASNVHSDFIAMGIPSLPTPERAVRAIASLVSYLELRKETWSRPSAVEGRSLRFIGGGRPLDSSEVSRLLYVYGIREPKTVFARTADDLRRVQRLKFPVVCKLRSVGLVHKSDIGGVVRGVASQSEVESVLARFRAIARAGGIRFGGMLVQEEVGQSVELLLGGTRDPTFGPMVAIGFGGTYAELIRDYSVAIAPVTPEEASLMVSRTKLGPILEGFRGGQRVDLRMLGRTVAAFSKILVENPRVEQVEVNPLMVREKEAFAVDARATLNG